ncbi:nucleoporin NUP37 [Fusarium tjaetaba]|uniref:Nucleoporin NUP37 n=1 Tax=Fusarium tjaetaba TaxID=1567544 RepID=A0A8H5QWQ0_9HYPO|nr:nucleoporin NUP37 [Fusarium tjaetaba]KAF5623681.1 nucleoporin NUP37 [Fusarium tjaetaba]
MSSIPAPRIRRTAQNTQFTYNLSRRVNDVQTYPVYSPQGATILIYGHENGVTIAWRGGKRFKAVKKAPPQPEKQNGNTDDSIMIIDSDDDEPPAKSKTASHYEDKPLFEDEIEDTPFPEIVQTLDLALGTAVLKVAVMPMTPTSADDAAWGGAKVLTEKMVFAVSCVTNDIYVITLPLTPPSPESKARSELRSDLLAGEAGSGAWGESLILLGGQNRHSEGIAINLIMPTVTERPGTKSRAVVASHCREASGVLRLWDVPLDASDKPASPVESFQTEYLPNPLTSISFNSTHTTQLLAVSAFQGVRIYDFARPSFTATDATGPFPLQGSWLLSMYQPFSRPSSTRKPIIDAAWIAHGRAILVLLADGMWGIWDVDGASPTAPGAIISNKMQPGVKGAALTTFSVSGYVEGTSSLRSVTTQNKEHSTGDFAPMTPHTRRQATASLSSAITLDRLATIRGGIKVLSLPSSGSAIQDETVVLWVGGLEHVCVIPGVTRFWDSQLRRAAGTGGDIFSGAQPVKMIKLMDLATGLLGERCCGVGLLIEPDHSIIAQDGGLPADVIVLGESRIVVVREGDDGPGKIVGAAANSRKRRLFSKGDKSDAIIVHGRENRPAKSLFNLSTVKPGTLRFRSASGNFDEDADTTLQPSSRTVGFDFMDTLEAAADDTQDFTRRNVEFEMLDIMEIDKTLDSMNGQRRT